MKGREDPEWDTGSSPALIDRRLAMRFVFPGGWVAAALAATANTLAARPVEAPSAASPIVAQRLVDAFARSHPEVASLEVAVTWADGCKTVAATEKRDHRGMFGGPAPRVPPVASGRAFLTQLGPDELGVVEPVRLSAKRAYS
jgi:hypothetical protein